MNPSEPHPPRKRNSLPMSLTQEVTLAVFLAGAPLAFLIAFHEDNFNLEGRVMVLAFGALFALAITGLLVFQIMHFVRTLGRAAERWKTGRLQYQILPSRIWCREFGALAEAQNEMAGQLDAL